MVIFLSMISVNGFGASETGITCVDSMSCEGKKEGASCGTNKTCKKINECLRCTTANNFVANTKICAQLSCDASNFDSDWKEDKDNRYRKVNGCSLEYDELTESCVETPTYQYACKSGYYVKLNRRQKTVGCVQCPAIKQGDYQAISGDIQQGNITLNTSTSVTSCYLPKSDTKYTDDSGTFVVTGDKCNATSQ